MSDVASSAVLRLSPGAYGQLWTADAAPMAIAMLADRFCDRIVFHLEALAQSTVAAKSALHNL
jgi:hypothetical protein